MLGQPSHAHPRGDRLQALRQAEGRHHRHRPRAHRHPDARKKGVVGKFVEFYGPGSSISLADAQPSPTWPGIRRHLRLLPGGQRDHRSISTRPAAPMTALPSWKPIPRPRACGGPPRPSIRSSPTRWNSISTACCLHGRPESVRRTRAALRFQGRLPRRAGRRVQEGGRERTSASPSPTRPTPSAMATG